VPVCCLRPAISHGNSGESALFAQAMASFSAALSAPLIAAYDFSPYECIADVGGGTGRLLADILAANPTIQAYCSISPIF
jgi:O-methyltransferase domain